MAGTVTVTGTAGPGLTVAAQVFTGVLYHVIDSVNNMIKIATADRVVDISVAAATTVTATKSGSTWTLVIS